MISKDEMSSLFEELEDNVRSFRDRLSDRDMNLKVQDDEKNNLLHLAVKKGLEKIVEFLIESGVPLQQNAHGVSPIDLAKEIPDEGVQSNISDALEIYATTQETTTDTKRLTEDVTPSRVPIREPTPEPLAEDSDLGIQVKEDILTKDLPAALQEKIHELPEKPWLDIPTLETLGTHEKVDFRKPIFKDLKELIEKYHALNRSDKNKLNDRIDFLKKIVAEIEKIQSKVILTSDETSELNDLKKQAFGKSIYLQKIAKRELDENWFKKFMFGNISADKPLLRTVRYETYGHELNLIFDVKEDQFGNATPYLDPCMRVGFRTNLKTSEPNLELFNKLYGDWLDELKKTSDPVNFPSFYLWLENKDDVTTKFVPQKQQGIELLDLRACQAEEGHLKLGALKENIDFEGDFTMTEDGRIFISKADSWTLTPNHPNIHFGYEPVLFAGSMKVEDGKIVEIMNFSGHFRPGPAHFKQFIDLLKEKNCLAENCQLRVFYTDEKGNGKSIDGPYKTIDFPDIIKKHHHKVKMKNSDGHLAAQYLTTDQIVENLKIEIQQKAVKKAAAKFDTKGKTLLKMMEMKKSQEKKVAIDEPRKEKPKKG